MTNINAHPHPYTVPDDPTVDDYINTLVAHFETTRNVQRWGQAAYNVLVDFRPGIARKVVGTNIDPFYVDGFDRMEIFFAFVARHWDENE